MVGTAWAGAALNMTLPVQAGHPVPGDQEHGCPPPARFKPNPGKIPALAQEKGAPEYIRGLKSVGCHALSPPFGFGVDFWLDLDGEMR